MAVSNQIGLPPIVETPLDLRDILWIGFFERIFPIEAFPFTAIEAKSNSKSSFLSLGFGLRKTLSTSASPLWFAENHRTAESGLPWVRSYSLSLVMLVTANLFTYTTPILPSR